MNAGATHDAKSEETASHGGGRRRAGAAGLSLVVVLGLLTLALLLRHLTGAALRPSGPLAVGQWRSLPVGSLKAGEIVYRLSPGGAATYVNDRRPGVTPVTWSQDGPRVTVWEHAADGSTGEYRFVLSADGQTLRQTDEIAYPSLSERLRHWDFSTEDMNIPIPFRKESP